MNKATLERIMNPGVKWIVYLYVIPHYIVDYKRYDADVFTGVSRGTAAVFQFHSAALRRLNKVGCQRYEGDYPHL